MSRYLLRRTTKHQVPPSPGTDTPNHLPIPGHGISLLRYVFLPATTLFYHSNKSLQRSATLGYLSSSRKLKISVGNSAASKDWDQKNWNLRVGALCINSHPNRWCFLRMVMQGLLAKGTRTIYNAAGLPEAYSTVVYTENSGYLGRRDFVLILDLVAQNYRGMEATTAL